MSRCRDVVPPRNPAVIPLCLTPRTEAGWNIVAASCLRSVADFGLNASHGRSATVETRNQLHSDLLYTDRVDWATCATAP